MNINCDDIVNIVHNQMDNDLDARICEGGVKVCDMLFDSDTIDVQTILQLDDEAYGYVKPLMKDICGKVFGSCQKSFCVGGDKDNKLTMTCVEFKDYLHRILDIIKYLPAEVQDKMPVKEFKYDDICPNLKQKMNSSPGMTVDGLAKYFGQGIEFGNNKYNDMIKKSIICVCPSLDNDVKPDAEPDTEPDAKPDAEPDIPKYNTPNIYITILIIIGVVFVLSIISIVILYTIKKLSLKTGFSVFIILLLLGGLVFLVLFLINPNCLYKYCFKDTDNWVPIEGHYKGSKNTFGLILDIDAHINKDNIVSFNKLECSGIWDKNLLKKCEDGNHSLVDVQNKINEGYMITGDCINKIKELTNKDDSKIINDIFIQKEGDKYNVFVSVNVIAPVLGRINTIVKIPLNKIKD
jgi:hypothetical protein